MRPIDDEPDYLAPAQLPDNPESFVQAVRRAFQLEYGCVQNQEIADVIGHDKSLVTQIFKKAPEKLTARSIRNLIDHLPSHRAKRQIVRAWIHEALNLDIDVWSRPTFVGKRVDRRTLKRIDRLIREQQLLVAADAALDAARNAKEAVLREELLDRAYFTRQRLNRPGQAMSIAREIAEGSAQRGDRLRLGAAHFFQCRILLGLPDSTPREIGAVLAQMEALLGPPPQVLPAYSILTADGLESFKLNAQLTFIERGQLPTSKPGLRRMLKAIERTPRKGEAYQDAFGRGLIAARIHLLLGETFAAREQIDKAFDSGKLANLNALELCGMVEARILKVTEPASSVETYLQMLSHNCLETQDLYHASMIERDLARLESEMFPPSHPVL